MALGRLTSFTFGNSFLTLVYANSQTYYVSYAHIIAGESDSRSGDLTIWIYTAGEVGETLSVKNSDLVAIGSSAAAFLALFNQNIQPYSYWQDFLDSTTASGALPSEPSALRGQCLYARFRPIYNFGSASLINVPARFKAGTLYSQVPNTGAGDFTVTRATTPTAGRSTRINKDGLIELVADNVPRLDYPLGGAVNGCPALLVEPSAINICLRSTWEGGGSTPTGWTLNFNTGTSTPVSSLLGADSVAYSFVTTLSRQFFTQTITISNATNYVFSFYIESINSAPNIGNIFLFFSGASNVVYLDPDGIVIGSGTAPTKTGRYKVTMLSTSTSTALRFGLGASNTVTGDLVLSRPQLETGSVATSYIPTTTAAITRGAEVVDRTGISSLMGQTQGTFYLDMSYFAKGASGTSLWLYIIGTPTSNNIGLAVVGTSVRSIVNGQSDILSTPSTANGVKIAWGYDGSGVVCFVNGVQYNLPNGGNQIITSMNRCIIDMSTAGGIRMADVRIRAIELYPNRLTNAQLATLTAP